MWVLKCENGDNIFYINEGKENIIGRNQGDLKFPNDKSISRKHATVYLDNGIITLEDHNSKYGTYLNEGIQSNTRIEVNIRIAIQENDLIRFGLLGNEWSLRKTTFKSCISTIRDADLAPLRVILDELGVSVCKEWSKDCTHLTMPSITLTLKVVLALVQNKPIVKPDYWTECLRCRNNNLSFPPTTLYLPDIEESSISQQTNFHSDNQRKTLFSGKRFIFLSRQQMKNYEEIIKSAEGQCSYTGDGSVTHGQISALNSIVIQHSGANKSSQDSQGKIDNIIKYLASKKKRIVPEMEIGLAILYISMEKYCNPSFNFASVIVSDKSIDLTEDNKILVPETQDCNNTLSLPSLPARFIDETLSGTLIKERFSISPSPSTSRVAYKRPAPPNNPEPNAKKRNISDAMKISQATNDNNLFSFVQDDALQKPRNHETEKIELTLSSIKRKRQNVECDDDNLFNFVPDTVKNITNATKRTSPRKYPKPVENILLNIGKNQKRKYDDLDIPDGKKPNLMASPVPSTPPNTSTIEKKFTCQKQNIDENGDDSTLEVISKLKDLDIMPAVVVVCSNLTVKRDSSNSSLDSIKDATRGADSKKNFKKFVKVKPLKRSGQVVSSNMLIEYQPKPGKSIPAQFLAESSDEEDNDNFRSFSTVNRPQKISRGRSRRL